MAKWEMVRARREGYPYLLSRGWDIHKSYSENNYSRTAACSVVQPKRKLTSMQCTSPTPPQYALQALTPSSLLVPRPALVRILVDFRERL